MPTGLFVGAFVLGVSVGLSGEALVGKSTGISIGTSAGRPLQLHLVCFSIEGKEHEPARYADGVFFVPVITHNRHS